MTTAERMAQQIEYLLPKVKANALITFDDDDEFLRSVIAAALDYARDYLKARRWRAALTPTTEQAVIMLATHFYESRDGSTAGFFADNTNAAKAVWETVHRLLSPNRRIEV